MNYYEKKQLSNIKNIFPDFNFHIMDEKKLPRFGGSKVSEIANIFQARSPGQKEDIITPLRNKQKFSHSITEKIDTDSPSVTVMRTESHVTRFNNARAMFEKLGEENKTGRDRIIPLQSTKSASSILDSRSRTSSTNSEPRDTKSQHGSRSPSPLENNTESIDNDNASKSNGFKDNSSEKIIDLDVSNQGVEIKNDKNDERIKPIVMKKPEKPEKPERKFNSKELIERQRNWTSHFSKTRSNRYNSDPNKSEVKLAVNNSSREIISDSKSSPAATRSASFSSRLKSPPTSPPPPPLRTDASRRPKALRKERPASVIPTTYTGSVKEESPVSSPSKKSPQLEDSVKDEVASFILTSPDNDLKDCSKLLLQNAEEKDNKKGCNLKCLHKDAGTTVDEHFIHKSPLEDKDASRENLSAASGSLSSLSPPSSPSKMKSEHEKQEQEGNEKSASRKFLYVY